MQDDMGGMERGSGPGAGTGGAMTELKAAGKDAAATAKEAVQGLKEQVAERASETVDTRKHAVADSLASVVNALRAAEKSLRDDNQEGLAAYSSSIALYVERSSGYVRNNDMNGLMGDLQRAGRENTGVFMGSSFAAGAALGRFLRASAPEPEAGSSSGNATADPRYTGGAGTPGGGYGASAGSAPESASPERFGSEGLS